MTAAGRWGRSPYRRMQLTLPDTWTVAYTMCPYAFEGPSTSHTVTTAYPSLYGHVRLGLTHSTAEYRAGVRFALARTTGSWDGEEPPTSPARAPSSRQDTIMGHTTRSDPDTLEAPQPLATVALEQRTYGRRCDGQRPHRGVAPRPPCRGGISAPCPSPQTTP
jgi:hypothetical protein